MRQDGSHERRQSWNVGLRERFSRLESRYSRAHPVTAIVDALADSRSQAAASEWTMFGISEEQRCLFESQRPNVLIIGSGASLERLVQLLERTCVPPIMRCSASRFTPPTSEVGTLTISHAERLSAVDQQLLFAWLSCTVPRPQVITTASVPLFPAVVRNTFSEALFYRLNSMCLMLRNRPVEPGVRELPCAR